MTSIAVHTVVTCIPYDEDVDNCQDTHRAAPDARRQGNSLYFGDLVGLGWVIIYF
jgi:hypothetical protein